MYTKEQLQGMSDFERNKVLANLLGLKISKEQYLEYSDRDERCVIVDMHSVGDKVVDYCNSPSDIMPLAFENEIDLIALEGGYAAEGNFSYLDFGQSDRCLQFYDVGNMGFKDKKPLRAIACCLILVLQSKE